MRGSFHPAPTWSPRTIPQRPLRRVEAAGADYEPQSDSHLRIETACGGQTYIDEDGYMIGAPEMAGEISYSSASYDLHAKKDTFRKLGVREYVVWRVEDKAFDWFRLRGARYKSLRADAEGVFRSEIFPGLWIDAASLLAGRLQSVLRVLQAGLASAEHQQFVEELAKRRAAKS